MCLPVCAQRKFCTTVFTFFVQEDAARKVFQQMLDALDYCHKLGIYHRCMQKLRSCARIFACEAKSLCIDASCIQFLRGFLPHFAGT